MCSWMARSIQTGRGQLPIPMTDNGSIAGAGDGGGSDAGISTGTAAQDVNAILSAPSAESAPLFPAESAAAARSAAFPFATR